MTPEGEQRKQRLLELVKNRYPGLAQHSENQLAMEKNMAPPLDPVVDPHGGPTPLYARGSGQQVANEAMYIDQAYADPHGGPTPGSAPMVSGPAAKDPMRELADTWGGRSPDIQGLFQRAAEQKSGGNVANAQGAGPVSPPASAPQSSKDQFLRAVALKGQATGGDTRRRDFMQGLQDFDENMQLPPSLISAWSPQGMHFLESTGGGPSKTRQAAIDDVNLRDRESSKNAAEIEAARVRQQSAAQTLARPDDADTAVVTGLDNTLNLIGELKAESKKWDLGPASMSMNKVAGMVGADDPQKTAFRQKSHTALVQMLQESAGKSMTPTEIENIKQTIPTVYDNDETYAAKLANVEHLITSKRATFMENKAKQGKQMGQLAERSTGAATKTFTGPDGKTVDIPNTDTASQQRLIAAGWK
jgi:hypothetical protein